MKASERRNRILKQLEMAADPISASALASAAGVSRQIVVGDIALLRAGGAAIVSTPRGYILETKEEPEGLLRRIACRHDAAGMEKELQICVDNGCQVLDVVVEHPVYGQLTGLLKLKSRYDIEQFMEKVAQSDAHALSELTDGVHLHTLLCPSQDAYDRAYQRLKEAGIIFEE